MIFDVQMFRDKLAKELFLDIISAVSLSVKECQGHYKTILYGCALNVCEWRECECSVRLIFT